MADVSPQVREQLQRGERETRTLVEQFVLDFRVLLRTILPQVPPAELAGLAAGLPVTRRMAEAGRLLLRYGSPSQLAQWYEHRSDTVRGWVAYAVAAIPGLTLAQRLQRLRRLADDPHFAVREWAWLALRPHLNDALAEAMTLLLPWTADASANLRRFAVEITRPRGVWCTHLVALKRDPTMGLPLLEPLRADASKYVQDSVANWLNDAGKTSPQWVRSICDRWRRESASPHTQRICRRATRNLREGEPITSRTPPSTDVDGSISRR